MLSKKFIAKLWLFKAEKLAKKAAKKILIGFIGAAILVPMLAGLSMFYIEMYQEAVEFINNPAGLEVSAADEIYIIYRERGRIKLTDKLLDFYVDNIESEIKPGTLADKKNNPCNLVFAGQPGAKKDGRFAVFRSREDGIRACIKQVAVDQGRNLTLRQFIEKFAPPFENDTETYIKQIAAKMKCEPGTKIGDLDTIELMKAMAYKESNAKIVENF